MQFPSLMFLRRIEQKTIRKRKLRNLTLLILRCLAIALLALAFARPYYKGYTAGSSVGSAQSVILIDNSYSMRYPGVFERARQAARKVITDAPASEMIALVLFAGSTDVVRGLKADRSEALALMDSLEPGLGATDYIQAVRAADSMLKESGKGEKRIFLVSDFHQVGLDHSGPPVKLSEGVEVTPIDVSDPSATNLCVSAVQADPVIFEQKYTGKVTALIAYSGSVPSGYEDVPPAPVDATVELKLNDLIVERKQIKVEAGSPQSVEFTGFNVPEGPNRALVSVSDDKLPIDNSYYFSINRELRKKVLAIETPSRARSESFYLQQALLAGANSPFELTVKSSANISASEIPQYRIVIVNDAVGINPDLSQGLANFAAAGGGLILVAGRSTEANEFNREFGQISPARIGDLVQMSGVSGFMSQVKTDHPLFSAFTKSGRLAPTRVYAYHSAEPGERSSVIAGLDDGHPLIIEGSSGAGKVLLFTTSLDNSLNDLPLTPMYLPLIHQMLDYLAGGASSLPCTVGQAFILPDNAVDGHLQSVESPTGKAVSIQQGGAGGGSAIASEAGFYRLKYNDHYSYVAANLDTRESDLSKLDLKEFLGQISSQPGQKQSSSEPNRSLSPEEIESRERLWLPILLMSLILFIAEALLARRIKLPRTIT